MIDRYRQFIHLRLFPTGRRLFAFKAVLVVAHLIPGAKLLCERIKAGILSDSDCLKLERSWRSQLAQGDARGISSDIDPLIDRVITAIVTALQSLQRALGPTHPMAIAAKAFEEQWFSGGASAITSLPYEQQLAETEGLLEEFANQETADTIEQLGLTVYINQLMTLTPQYRAEIEKIPNKDLTYAKVVAARKTGQRNLERIVARILGTWDLDDDMEIREMLLAPIIDQNTRIYEAMRSGRKSPDVDPDTGKELEVTGA